ncbi:MAG TPA: DDE-type integrase/transposase/recombinase [Candidatus Bathyarchaeia archaeon]|nr:DDE-type integrase/transposase/recombinase [Candidatus Bathyarchaeia archaeon]
MKEPSLDFRDIKGEEIARQYGWVRRLNEYQYKVHSQRLNAEYDVVQTEGGWFCSCPDRAYRMIKCKHIRAVELSFIFRKIVSSAPLVIEPVSVTHCPSCNSEKIVKHGVRHNQSGDIQRWSCKDCGKWFTINLGFEKMKATPQAVTSAMQLYFTGESFRNVQKFLRLQGVNVSHVTIHSWIRKYVAVMGSYLDKLIPRVGDIWRTDEIFLKVKGDMKYLFAMMDDDTRFWIAQQVSDHKAVSDVRPMFRDAMEKAGKKPRVLISDGAWNYVEANTKEYWTRYADDRTQHIRDIRFGGEVHNNKMERMNGEIRDREKVMRGLKKSDTPILKGYQIFHNFIRPHEGLNGQTPSERAGIRIEGENKWLTIIRNASQENKRNQGLVS